MLSIARPVASGETVGNSAPRLEIKNIHLPSDTRKVQVWEAQDKNFKGSNILWVTIFPKLSKRTPISPSLKSGYAPDCTVLFAVFSADVTSREPNTTTYNTVCERVCTRAGEIQQRVCVLYVVYARTLFVSCSQVHAYCSATEVQLYNNEVDWPGNRNLTYLKH